MFDDDWSCCLDECRLQLLSSRLQITYIPDQGSEDTQLLSHILRGGADTDDNIVTLVSLTEDSDSRRQLSAVREGSSPRPTSG